MCTMYSVDIKRKRAREKLCEGYKEKDKDRTWASTTRTLEHPTNFGQEYGSDRLDLGIRARKI